MAEIDSKKDIGALFAGFQAAKAVIEFPQLGIMSQTLTKEVKAALKVGGSNFAANGQLQRLFPSAAVEMWQRAVHSFTISAGLTLSSPMWAAIAGYYSSHYVIRAYAHLVGRFVLYTEKKVVCLHTGKGGFHCEFSTKGGADREHQSYWRIVRDSPVFNSDPLLTVPTDGVAKTDGAHRVRANYADHVAGIPKFRALTLKQIVDQVNRISEIELTAVPVPDVSKYPDLWNVQLIAYHRLVGFREFLDSLLGDKNRFWAAHRSPEWCRDVVKFTRTPPKFITAAP